MKLYEIFPAGRLVVISEHSGDELTYVLVACGVHIDMRHSTYSGTWIHNSRSQTKRVDSVLAAL